MIGMVAGSGSRSARVMSRVKGRKCVFGVYFLGKKKAR
jgi:hypothetical protein